MLEALSAMRNEILFFSSRQNYPILSHAIFLLMHGLRGPWLVSRRQLSQLALFATTADIFQASRAIFFSMELHTFAVEMIGTFQSRFSFNLLSNNKDNRVEPPIYDNGTNVESASGAREAIYQFQCGFIADAGDILILTDAREYVNFQLDPEDHRILGHPAI
jgi:hypothetical protein